jgi:hypothetical protein
MLRDPRAERHERLGIVGRDGAEDGVRLLRFEQQRIEARRDAGIDGEVARVAHVGERHVLPGGERARRVEVDDTLVRQNGLLDDGRQVAVPGREPPSARACLAELVGVALVFPVGDRDARILGLLGVLGLLRLEIARGRLLRIDAVRGIRQRTGRARGPGIGRPSGVGDALVIGRERGVGLVRW